MNPDVGAAMPRSVGVTFQLLSGHLPRSNCLGFGYLIIPSLTSISEYLVLFNDTEMNSKGSVVLMICNTDI